MRFLTEIDDNGASITGRRQQTDSSCFFESLVCFHVSLVFTLVYKNQKLIIYLMVFSLVWGKDICIEKMTNVSCALSMTGVHSCSWM